MDRNFKFSKRDYRTIKLMDIADDLKISDSSLGKKNSEIFVIFNFLFLKKITPYQKITPFRTRQL